MHTEKIRMKRRPWGIVIMAAMQLTAPVTSILVSAAAWHASPKVVLDQFIQTASWPQYMDFFVIPLVAAVSIYAFRVWSYALFFGICAWTIGQNTMLYLSHRNDGISMGWVLFAQAINLAIVSYFLFPGVRATYFNRRLRWWETRPRYKVSVDGAVSRSEGAQDACEILDVSVGGVFLRMLAERPMQLGEMTKVAFEVEGYRVEIDGKIVHQGRILKNSFGLQFTDRNRARLRTVAQMIKTLDQKGYVSDRRMAPWQEDLKNWLKDVVHTAGRSIVPTIPVAPSGVTVPENVIPISAAKRKPSGSSDSSDQSKAA